MRLVSVLAVVGILSAATVTAEPLVIQTDHVAYGVQDVLVDGVLYDVTFRYGTYSEVFTIPPALMVPYNLADVNGNGGKSNRGGRAVTGLFFGKDISAVGDGFGVTSRQFMTPGMIAPNGIIYGATSDAQAPLNPYLWITDGGAPAVAEFDNVRMYAVFTESTATPEPSTLLLSGLGLAIAAMRRRALS